MALDQQQAAIQRALGFVSQEQADALIEPSREYQAMMQAGEALAQMLWALAQGVGALEREDALQMMAQGETILLALLHDAWALGVKQGRAR
jgi:hypothetical protein